VIADPDVRGLVIVGDDPFHYLNKEQVRAGLANKEFILVADALPTRVMEFAHVTVPLGTFAEKSGTYVAEDGYVRTLTKAMDGPQHAFGFFNELFARLGGTRYGEIGGVFEKLAGEGVFESTRAGARRLASHGLSPRFNTQIAEPAGNGNSGYRLVLRNLFMSHHLMDVDIYAKGIAKALINTAYPISGGKLFMSPEDANALGLSQGNEVIVESGAGQMKHVVSLKEGLRQGVLEYVCLKDREPVLGLLKGAAKVMDVTVKKA
jgi:anaerobic selenocysteine-containing dehydrogenase